MQNSSLLIRHVGVDEGFLTGRDQKHAFVGETIHPLLSVRNLSLFFLSLIVREVIQTQLMIGGIKSA